MFERRVLGEDLAVLVPLSLEAEGFGAAFTERTGGVSDGPFRSLNLGFASGDERDRVLENRRRLQAALGVGALALVRQVHGAGVVRVPGPSEGAGPPGADGPSPLRPTGDVLTTLAANVPLSVLVADCVPVALADPATGQVAAVHAGWRGIAAGVLEAAVAAFPRPRSLLAAVGPAVGPDHYEVGPEVAAAVRRATSQAVVVRTGGALRLDLGATVERTLRDLGVARIERAELCTACLPERFFSYRRDRRTGRQALVAWRVG
ncbi:MAG TPA: peptidoglycan editing factor PgeF [Actinomycetota bacterium]|nr:peptidoglycan editing factor PgeF [Actinomycetota bacterium]